ncbi:hypothetical protein QBC39DRAFT_35645 [Podospora conica]|nr:hypothetical protein QBC39DRAFT_35645 [Schizothecium conicum]
MPRLLGSGGWCNPAAARAGNVNKVVGVKRKREAEARQNRVVGAEMDGTPRWRRWWMGNRDGGSSTRSLDATEAEAEGRKEADRAGHFNKRRLQRCSRRWFAHSSAEPWPECWHIQELLGRLGAGLGQRETVSSVEKMEKSRRRAWPWRQMEGRTKPLGGRPQELKGPRARTTGPPAHSPAVCRRGLRPRAPRAPPIQGPPRCLVARSKAIQDGRMRPSEAASAGRRINTAQVVVFALGGELTRGGRERRGREWRRAAWPLSIGHIGKALGVGPRANRKVAIPFAIPTAEMPGRGRERIDKNLRSIGVAFVVALVGVCSDEKKKVG